MYQPVLVLVLAGWAGAQFATVQTFGTGSGGSGAAESSHTRPDGVTEGECAYFNTQGKEVKVRYEKLGGVLQSVKSSVPSGNAELQLSECQAAASKIHQNLQSLQNNLLRQQQSLFSNLPFMAGVLPAAFPGAGAAGSFTGAFAGGQNGGFAVGGNFGNGLPQAEVFGAGKHQGQGSLQGTPNTDVLNFRRVNSGVVPGGSAGSSSSYDGVYSSSGVSISNAIGNDGISRTQCSYSDGNGNIIKINIAESPAGQSDVEVINGNPQQANEYLAECQRLSEQANQQARLAQIQGQEQARQAQQQAVEAQKNAQEQIAQQQQQVAFQTAALEQQLAAQHAAIMQQHQNLMQNLQNQIPFFNGRRR